MSWAINRDEALVGSLNGAAVAGIWRGAWLDRGVRHEGVLAAIWIPSYHRVGRFHSAREAKAAIEALLMK